MVLIEEKIEALGHMAAEQDFLAYDSARPIWERVKRLERAEKIRQWQREMLAEMPEGRK